MQQMKAMSRLCRASAAAVWMVVSACDVHDPKNYQLNPAAPNEPGIAASKILDPSAAPESLPADGLSRTVITAKIDPTSTSRTITFETSHGTLTAGGKTATAAGGKISVDADDLGLATVELQAAAQVAQAKVTITASAKPTTEKPNPPPLVVRTLEVPFTAVDLASLLTLQTDTASLPADGFSTTVVTAVIKATGGDVRQHVVFRSTQGDLVRSVTDKADPAPDVQADAAGVAQILLRSTTFVGTARVTATMGAFERAVNVQFTPINAPDVISVKADASVAPADGTTRTRLVATIAAGLPSGSRKVKFTTTDGEFASSTTTSDMKTAEVDADSSNRAVIELRSPSVVGSASITASVAGFATAYTTMEFSKALPDSIFVSATDSEVARAGTDAVDITVTLLRDIGAVTTNTVVTYEARDSGGHPIGAFSNITLAQPEQGDAKTLKSTARFNPADTADSGLATITVRVGDRRGTISIQLN
jgi:hypothetical protein